jgi:hypothetical protein
MFSSVQKNPQRLPGPQAFGDLLRISGGIAGRAERVERQLRRRLVMQSARRAATEESRDDVGTDRADVPDEIAGDRVRAPLLDALIEAEGIAEVDSRA